VTSYLDLDDFIERLRPRLEQLTDRSDEAIMGGWR
jgi:hypothetical protein